MLAMGTMPRPELHRGDDMRMALHGGRLAAPHLWTAQPGDTEQLQHAHNEELKVKSSSNAGRAATASVGFTVDSLLFAETFHGISNLISNKTERDGRQLHTAVYPEATRLQNDMPTPKEPKRVQDVDFRHGTLPQNMTALKPSGDARARQSLSEHLPEQQTWEQDGPAQEASNRPAVGQRNTKKDKVKTQKEKDAEKRELEPICCVNCEVRWAPMPRQGMCNACGIYLAQNKRPRPIALAEHLRAKQPWKFITDTPPGHVLIKKDNGRLVAVPIEDAEASPRADDPDNAPPSRPVSAAFLTADEEAEAVRRSSRQRRPPAHLSDDDYVASDAEPASEDDKAAPGFVKTFPGFQPRANKRRRTSDPASDDSEQSDDDVMMMDAEEPLGQEDIMARYAHTSWETIEDDTFFAESLLYLKHSQTPVKTRKRMYDEIAHEALPAVPEQALPAAAGGFAQAPAVAPQGLAGAPKKNKEKRPAKAGGPCTNCGATSSSMWRPHNSKDGSTEVRCNACGIYISSYLVERPIDEFGNLDKAAAKKVSNSRANSRKRVSREASVGSEATGQGFLPSRSGSLPAPPAPAPIASAFAPKAANPAVFNISVDACGSVPAAMFFENGATPSQRMHHLARQISAAGSGTLQRALFMAAEKPRAVAPAYAPASAPMLQ